MSEVLTKEQRAEIAKWANELSMAVSKKSRTFTVANDDVPALIATCDALEAELIAERAQSAKMREALELARGDTVRIHRYTDLGNRESAMDCIGMQMVTLERALALTPSAALAEIQASRSVALAGFRTVMHAWGKFYGYHWHADDTFFKAFVDAAMDEIDKVELRRMAGEVKP